MFIRIYVVIKGRNRRRRSIESGSADRSICQLKWDYIVVKIQKSDIMQVRTGESK